MPIAEKTPRPGTKTTVEPYPGARREDGGVIVERYSTPQSIGFSREAITEARENKVLFGKVVLVVGASYNGIGGAVAREAAFQGATVVASSRDKSQDGDWFNNFQPKALVKELGDLGSTDSDWIPADITTAKDRQRLIDEIVRKFGRIDGLVLTPAVLDDDFFVRLSEARIRKAFETNLWGPLFLVQQTVEQMRKQKPRGGKIVIVSSLAAVSAPFQAEYGPAKAALDNLIQSLPEEQLYRDTCFNAVSPGLVETPIIADLTQEQRRAILQITTADRELLPQEVGELIVHLLSPGMDANGKLVSIIGKGDKPDIDDRNLIPDEPTFKDMAENPDYQRINKALITRSLRDLLSRTGMSDVKILDLACSDGHNTALMKDDLTNLGIRSEIVGLDIDRSAIARATRNVEGNETVTIRFEEADATQRLPFAEETFDEVMFPNAWHEIQDDDKRQAAANEIARVTKPGGTTHIHSAFTEKMFPPGEFRKWGLIRVFATHNLDIKVQGKERKKDSFKILELKEACRMLKEAGLEINDDVENLEENEDIVIEEMTLSADAIRAIAKDGPFVEGFFADVPGAEDIPYWRKRDAIIAAVDQMEERAKEKGEELEVKRNWVTFRARRPETSTVSRADTTAQGPTVPLESTGSIY